MAIVLNSGAENRRRIQLLFLLISLMYVAVIGRLGYLQLMHGAQMRHRAIDGRTRERLFVPTRGAILDREHQALAANVARTSLVCDPSILKPEVRTDAIALVSRAVGMEPAAVQSALEPRVIGVDSNGRPRVARNNLVAKDLSSEQVAAIRALQSGKTTMNTVRAFSLVDEPRREYPFGSLAIHMVGLTQSEPIVGAGGKAKAEQLVGITGFEKELNDVLAGAPGDLVAEVDRRGLFIKHTDRINIPMQEGQNVVLTLDATVQHTAESALKELMEKHRPRGATVIVLDPLTGDVLAVASAPTFHPANMQERREIERHRNRAFELYEPGSTLKTISVLAALQEGLITPETRFSCSGSLLVGSRPLRCVLHGAAERHGHGVLKIDGVLEKSCNVSAAMIGMKLGMERTRYYLDRFGLLSKTNLQVTYDPPGTLGRGRAALEQGSGKVARVAFGQAVMVTPMALAAAYASVFNGGVYRAPRIVQAYEDQSGRVTRTFDPSEPRQVVAPEVAKVVRDSLERAVYSGTGKLAAVPGYTTAGKTGTAWKVVPGVSGYASGKYVASFFGAVPARNPRVVIGVVVDEPQGGMYGGTVAAPVFKTIAERLMLHWKVPPDRPETLGTVKLVSGR